MKDEAITSMIFSSHFFSYKIVNFLIESYFLHIIANINYTT